MKTTRCLLLNTTLVKYHNHDSCVFLAHAKTSYSQEAFPMKLLPPDLSISEQHDHISSSAKISSDLILFWLKSFTSIDPSTDQEATQSRKLRLSPSFSDENLLFSARQKALPKEVTNEAENEKRRRLEEKIPARRSNFGGARRRLATRPYARVRASKLKRREKAGFRARTFRKHLPRSLKLRN